MLVPAVRAGGPPQLVRGVEGLGAPQKLQVELYPPQVVWSQQLGLVPRQGVVLWDELTWGLDVYIFNYI